VCPAPPRDLAAITPIVEARLRDQVRVSGEVGVGTHLEVSGTVGVFHNRLVMLNPSYQLLSRDS